LSIYWQTQYVLNFKFHLNYIMLKKHTHVHKYRITWFSNDNYCWTQYLNMWCNDNIFLPCSCTMILTHTMLPLKIGYVPKFIKINTNLWLVDCTFAICSEKCKMRTASQQKTSLNDAKFPPHLTHLPRCECYGMC